MYLQRTKGGLNPRGQQPQSNLQVSTVRSFEGGLNVADTDLNMSPKYARVLDNLERATDGSLALRPGTRLFSDHLWDTSDVVNHVYFNGYIIAVQTSGAFTKVDGTGAGTNMSRVAAPPNTRPWGPTLYTSFTIFNNDLICSNGSDKPILVKGSPADPNYMNAQYLVDEATLTNINTPVGKYVVAHGQYTIIAGVPTEPSTIYISSKGTSGTYYADPLPNDGIKLDLGPRVSLGSSTITGLVAYRDKLLVTFERGVLPLNLGIYTGTAPAVHTPTDDGFVEEYGCLCHRSLISVGDDTFFNDNVGVNSIARVNMFNTLRPLRASHLIDPLTTAAIQPLTTGQIQQYMFAVYDLRNFRYMLFVPVFDSGGALQETICFSYTNVPALKVQAWARLRGWKWQSACRTALQNIIFSRGNKLYSYTFDDVQHTDLFADPAENGGNGYPIEFDWEMPWADMKHRMMHKMSRYIAMDTQGTAQFTVRAYVDDIYTSGGGDAPLLTMQFTGGDVPASTPAYPGRTTTDERLYAFPIKYRMVKLRFSGSATTALRFVSISLAFILGSVRR